MDRQQAEDSRQQGHCVRLLYPHGTLTFASLDGWVGCAGACRIPMVDVDETNGCIELIPGYSQHKRLVLRQHATVQPYREALLDESPTAAAGAVAMADPIKVPV